MTPQQANDLQKCPCCNGESYVARGYCVNDGAWDGEFFRAYCGTCQLRQLFYRTEAEAIAAWNRRAPAPTEPAVDRDAVSYTCEGKGGVYSLIGTAYGAGKSRGQLVTLYAEVSTGVRYFRTAEDFTLRMRSIATPASPAVPGSFLDQLEHAIGGYSGGPFDAVSALIEAQRAHPNCGACPGNGTVCKASCRVADESPAQQVAQPSGNTEELPQVAQASQPTSAEAVAIAKPVMYQQRIIAPNGNIGTWYEVEASVYRRYAANSDAGDGFRFEGRALYLQPTSAEGKDSERLEGGA